MTRSEIIELSTSLTERKGEKVLNMKALFAFVCQDICKRQRFWWRRGLVTFTIQANVSTYDLSTITTVPESQLSEIGVEEVIKLQIITSQSPLTFTDLGPVFDADSLIGMMANTTPIQPGQYTMEANDYKTLRVDLPDADYTAYLAFWGISNPATDSSSDAVPLIPPWGHNAIVAGLNAKIFKFAYGSKNPKTIDAEKEYEQAIDDLQMKSNFSPNKRTQVILGEAAIQSH